MRTVEFKLKQASAALGVPPKELQNLVQLGVVSPRRRDRIFWFDLNLLLQAKVAFYLKESLGASSEVLARCTEALARDLKKTPGKALRDIRLGSRPPSGKEAVEIKVPLRSLARELQEQLALAAEHKDLPRGRKRAGWKKQLVRNLEDAARDLKNVPEDKMTRAIRDYRLERKKLPEIAVVARTKKKTA